MALISIIVPIYNTGRERLQRCIDSILAQTFTDFELILVDDGSTDESSAVCDEYAQRDERIHVIHQANQGVSVARNTGIDAAKSPYIAFADSDDATAPTYLGMMLDKMTEFNPDLIISSIAYYYPYHQQSSFQNRLPSQSILFDKSNADSIASLIRFRKFNYVYAKLFRKKIITTHDIQFDGRVTLGEDTMFVMDYIKHTQTLYYIDRADYFYYQYGRGSLSTTFSPNNFNRLSLVNDYIEESFHALGALVRPIEVAIAERRIWSAIWSINDIKHRLKTNPDIFKHLSDILCNDKLQSAFKLLPNFPDNSIETQIIHECDPHKLLKLWRTTRLKKLVAKTYIGKIYLHIKHGRNCNNSGI